MPKGKNIRLNLTSLHPPLLHKRLAIIPEPPNMLRKVVIKLPPNFNVGENLLVLQIPVLEFLQRLFPRLGRGIAVLGIRKCAVGLANLSGDLILVVLFLFDHLLV